MDAELIDELIKYIEDVEEQIEGEWGRSASIEELIEEGEMPEIYNKLLALKNSPPIDSWFSVDYKPLYTEDERGNWVCTEDGDGEFIAAVPYTDITIPNETFWWIRHCVVEDEIGLCVVGEDWNEPAVWSLEDVTHWMPMPQPPKNN